MKQYSALIIALCSTLATACLSADAEPNPDTRSTVSISGVVTDPTPCAAGECDPPPVECAAGDCPTPTPTPLPAYNAHADVVQVNPVFGSLLLDSGWTVYPAGTGMQPAALLESNGAAVAYFPIRLLEGDRLKSIAFSRFGNGVTDVSVFGFTQSPTGVVSTAIGGAYVLNASNTWQDTVIDVPDTTIAGGAATWFEIKANGSGFRLGAIRVTYDHP